MRSTQNRAEMALFVSLTAFAALYLVLATRATTESVLDPLIGVIAIITGATVVVRLTIGVLSKPVRLLWTVTLTMLALVSVCQFFEPLSDRIEGLLGVDGIADCVPLFATPLILWISARCDPIPVRAQRFLWIAFLLQIAATAADFYGDRYGSVSGGDDPLPAIDFLDFVSMQFYLLAAAHFVGTLRTQALALRRGPRAVGDLARHLFVARGLFKKQRYPRIDGFALPGGKSILEIGRFFLWFGTVGPRVRHTFGIPLSRQLAGIGHAWLRHGLDAQAYYLFELYHPEYAAQASGFLTRYETKNGLFKILTYELPKGKHRTLLGDKAQMQQICAANDISHIPSLLMAEGGIVKFYCDRAELDQDLFIKPRQAKGARNTELLRYADGLYRDQNGSTFGQMELLHNIAQKSENDALLVQPRIRNHPDIADLARDSLIVVRVITCLDEDGNVVVTHGMLRVLGKLEPTWPSDNELGAPVCLSNGVLGLMTGDKADMAFDRFAVHPFTGAQVLGRKMPCWPRILELAVAAHSACPDRLLVGWDIAVDPNGPRIVEGNSYADVDFLQRVARQSIGQSKLGPLLFSRLIALERRLNRDMA